MSLFSDDLFNVFEEEPEAPSSRGKKRHRGKDVEAAEEAKRLRVAAEPPEVAIVDEDGDEGDKQ